MIGHPAICVNLGTVVVRSVHETVFQDAMVFFVAEYCLTGISVHRDVIEATRDVRRTFAHSGERTRTCDIELVSGTGVERQHSANRRVRISSRKRTVLIGLNSHLMCPCSCCLKQSFVFGAEMKYPRWSMLEHDTLSAQRA